jgi:predicted ATPase
MRDELRTLIGGIESTVGPRLPDLGDVPPPFFGRGKDLDVLRHVLSAVRTDGECRSVTVVGAAGIGKTRIVDEFVRWVKTLDDPPVRVFRSVGARNARSWSSFTQILSERFELTDATDLEEAKTSVRNQVAAVLDDRKVGDVLYLLGDLLELDFPKSPLTKALDDGGPETSALKRAILKSFLEADASFGPMCLVFDDLHLCHEQTLSMLRFLIENVSAPILFLCAAKPELLSRGEGWAQTKRHSLLNLAPLGAVDTAALIGSLLTPEGMTPMHLVEQAREVTGGNPGRIEEAARFYHDKGTLPPPPSGGERSIDSRIDELSPAERLLLQQAALTRGVFWLGGLVVLDRAERETPGLWDASADESERELAKRLEQLAERNYILRLPDSTFPGDEEYVFKHRLERDRMSELTSAQDARRWHRLLADWLDCQPETSSHEEYLETLAEQREKSGSRDGAASSYLEAAARARAHASHKRELAYYEKALALLGEDHPGRRLDALLRLGELHEMLDKPEAALDCYRSAFVLAFRLNRRSAGRASQFATTRLLAKLGRTAVPATAGK